VQVLSTTQTEVTLSSSSFLHGVRLSAKGYLPDDNYFHLPPSRRKTVVFSAIDDQAGPFKASVEALNLADVQFIAPQKQAEGQAAVPNLALVV
jgi:Ig-fold domain